MPVDAPPAEALDLRESIDALTLNLAEAATAGEVVKPDGTTIKLGFDHKGDLKEGGVFDEQGRVPLHIIRPGLGRGKGRHLYEASMLQANAEKFTGWKQYVNHLSPEAKKAAGGLPRDWQDLGGRITESWWDPSVPKTDRFDQGAVVGMSKPTPMVGAIIDHDPEIAEASICASATGVKQGTHGGERCWVVEGIEPKGSVDWVTEAGAGGRVVSIMEAAIEEDAEGRLALLASMDDEEFVEYVQKERPDLLTEAAEPVNKPKKDPSEEDDDMPEITAEALSEALVSPDFRSLIAEALEAVVPTLIDEAVEEKISDLLPTLVESAVEAERDIIRATAKADADRRVQIERMRASAHAVVEAAALPTEFKDEIKSKFDIDESGAPKSALDQTDEIDGDGEVTKKAEDKVTESVTEEITKATKLVAAANPTRVRGQGPSVQEGDDPEAAKAQQAGVVKGGLMESLLRESGFEDPAKVYDLQG